MTTYIYFVKCPGCEDEHFDFFDEAKEFALGCLSQKPIITQTEVERNDFGECTDSADLGTVWSWEDIMGETEAEPTNSIFTKDDLKPWIEDKDSEFDSLDNSVEFPVEEALLDEAVADDLQPGVVYTLKDDAFICEAEDSSIKGFLSNPNTTTIAHVKNTYTKGDDIIIPAKAKLRYVKDYQVNNVNYQMFSDGKVVFLFSHSFANHLITEAMETRKPVPEGMTIEQLVEEMEENEDTVECTWCNDLFDKDQCRYEVNLGWLCSRCEAAIKSRGETLTFKENNYWDFLDENHKPITWICEFDGKEIGTVDAVTEEEAYEAMENKYPDLNYSLYDGVAVVYPADKNELTEASLSDIAAAANSEFGTSWDDDYLLDMAGVDDDFRSIDSFGDTLPKTRKSRELSPEKIAEREAKAAEHERQKNMRFAQRYVAKYGAERYNTQYPVRRQNWRQEWPYYDETTGEFVEGERRDELVKKFEDEQHAKRMAEYEEHLNQPRWYIQTRYNGKWHNLMNTTATTKEDAESWALDYMKNLEAERRAAGGRFDWKETDIRVVAGKGPGPGVPQRFEEDFDPEELHDLGNEYDGGYPNETPEVSNSHLKLCPECGKEAFDTETGICIECGFN